MSLESKVKTLHQWKEQAERKLEEAYEEDKRNEDSSYSEGICHEEYGRELIPFEDVRIMHRDLEAYKADYRCTFEDWWACSEKNIALRKKLVEADKLLDELQKDNFRGLTSRVQDHIDHLRALLFISEKKESVKQ